MTKLFGLDDCKEINRSARSKRLAKTVMDPETPDLPQREWARMYSQMCNLYDASQDENQRLRFELMFLADHRRPQ
jgi:hypothetical protein